LVRERSTVQSCPAAPENSSEISIFWRRSRKLQVTGANLHSPCTHGIAVLHASRGRDNWPNSEVTPGEPPAGGRFPGWLEPIAQLVGVPPAAFHAPTPRPLLRIERPGKPIADFAPRTSQSTFIRDQLIFISIERIGNVVAHVPDREPDTRISTCSLPRVVEPAVLLSPSQASTNTAVRRRLYEPASRPGRHRQARPASTLRAGGGGSRIACTALMWCASRSMPWLARWCASNPWTT
jgi:hypothetical protein